MLWFGPPRHGWHLVNHFMGTTIIVDGASPSFFNRFGKIQFLYTWSYKEVAIGGDTLISCGLHDDNDNAIHLTLLSVVIYMESAIAQLLDV